MLSMVPLSTKVTIVEESWMGWSSGASAFSWSPSSSVLQIALALASRLRVFSQSVGVSTTNCLPGAIVVRSLGVTQFPFVELRLGLPRSPMPAHHSSPIAIDTWSSETELPSTSNPHPHVHHNIEREWSHMDFYYG